MTLSPEGFSRNQRVRDSREFEEIYAGRCKASDGVLLVFARKNQLAHSRLGLSVSRRHGGAIVRNQLKRWLREAFRTQQEVIPAGYDFVVVPLDRRRASHSSYRESLRKVALRLVRRLSENRSQDG